VAYREDQLGLHKLVHVVEARHCQREQSQVTSHKALCYLPRVSKSRGKPQGTMHKAQGTRCSGLGTRHEVEA